GGQRRIFLVRGKVREAVIDVVHRHYRGRGARGSGGFRRKLAFDFRFGRVDERLVASAVGGREQQTVFALIAERGVVEQRADVEADILGEIGKRFRELLERHWCSPWKMGKKRARN